MGKIRAISNKIRNNVYVELFTAFFRMGMFTFGGGLAMIPLIQKMAVEDYKWLTEEEMVDCIAVTQAMPGVIAINAATYIGNRTKGFAGAFFATLGVIMPSFIIIIAAVLCLSFIGENTHIKGAFKAITASSCALIMYSALKLGKQVVKGPFSAVLAAISFISVAFFDVNAVIVIITGAMAGFIHMHIKNKKAGSGPAAGRDDI